MTDYLTTESLMALLTLTSLEVVLGIENVIFIAILAGKLPEEQRDYARKMGLAVAVLSRAMVMLVFSKAIVSFIERHPAIKILALSFLLLIGTLLIAEGFHQKIPKGYVYFAMAFSLGVDFFKCG